jgi:ATP adenylyltransferase/5',5'''-P-1,P-4-tetraphosphate phosphorylase II
LIRIKFSDNPKIHYLNTTKRVVSVSGYPFVLAHGANDTKPNDRYNNNFGKNITKKNNPFAPPLQEELVITHDLNEKNRLLINKFPLLDTQMIIVSKEFRPQTEPLDPYDFESILTVLQIEPSSIFYFNCGKLAGASIPHKHIQTVSEKAFTWSNGTTSLSLMVSSLASTLNSTHPSIPLKLKEFDFPHQLRLFKYFHNFSINIVLR